MPTFGFVIDNRKCIGCHACTVACKSEHEVPLGVDRTWVKYIEKGTFPNSRRLFTVMRCNHCDYAPCVTICPVTALYRRKDGVVDFNSDRCIGCKACMQACPYDALFIDPNSNTAAKCNYCTHRLEVGLEPSCVVVCPEQAIVAGDISDPASPISQLIDRHPVQVRKPEKGTQPKLYYIEGDEAALVPSRTSAEPTYVWSSAETPAGDGPVSEPASPRRTYDVRKRPVAWGWQVAAYTWTKSLAAGGILAALAIRLMGSDPQAVDLRPAFGLVGLIFLALTCALLVGDLKKPQRFLNVLLRPQWRSWLVRGAYMLTAYSLVLTGWLVAVLLKWETTAELLLWPGVALAALTAIYTAFLFAQAKGRDFWQNPLFSIHLLTHAVLAGAIIWLLAAVFTAGETTAARWLVAASVGFSLLAVLGELFTTHCTDDARAALHMIVWGPMKTWFWVGGIGLGHLLPLALLASGTPAGDVAACLLILTGVYIIESLWVEAPQRIPLS